MKALRSFSAFDGERFLDGGATVLVEGDTIVGVEPAAYDVPEDCEVSTYAGTLMPGLIDCHVHLVFDAAPGGIDSAGELSDGELDDRIVRALQQQVRQGVTTVRDLGDVRFRTLLHRDRRQQGVPRILAAGPPLTVAGGHCHFLGGVVDDVPSIDAAVRDRVERGVDVIKVMASGGILTPNSDQFGAQFDVATLRALGELAHAHDLRVLAHSHSLLGMEAAAAAGLDGIEHFSGLRRGDNRLPADLLDRVAETGIGVCPTLGQDEATLPPPELMPPGFVKVFRELGMPPETPAEELWDFFTNLRREHMAVAYSHGLRLISGSDAGVAPPKPHGGLFRAVLELAAVMPLAEALATATSLAADDCGVPAGRLRQGLSADLVVLEGDLQKTPDCLGSPLTVMVRGQLIPAGGDSPVPSVTT